MRKLLSVIVPVYNVEPYLARCVDSLLAQDYSPMEILLVDDGSTDGSGAICDGYACRDARVQVIHKENGGLSSARNAGLDRARGAYLTFVDSDDYLEPGVYGPMVAMLERENGNLVCAGRYDRDADTGEKTVGLCPGKSETISGEALAGRIFQWEGCDSSACDKLFGAELFDGLRFPEGKTCEDIPVIYQTALRAERAVMWDRPVYNYCHRKGSITKSALSEKFFDQDDHTAEIYGRICREAPALIPQARYLRVWTLATILVRITRADSQVRERFRARYAAARRELAGHTLFFLTYPRFSAKERIRNLLLVLGVYGALRPFFTKDPTVRL